MNLVTYRPRRFWDPIRDFGAIEREFDRLFANGKGEDKCACNWAPATDFGETESAYTVSVDLPGVTKEDISISVHDNVLTLKGERKSETEESNDGNYRVERWRGAFERTFRLPKDVKQDDIQARYENGVLHVTVPKAEEAKPKLIEVSVN